MTDRPAEENGEIEITPEMIEAGVEELLGFFPEDVFDTPRPIIIDIYSAMARLVP